MNLTKLLSFLGLLGACLFVIMLNSLAAEEFEREEAELQVISLQYLQDHDIRNARNKFLALYKKNQNYPAPLYNLGRLAEKEEDWEQAIAWYTQYIQLDQTSDYSVRARLKIEALTELKTNDADPTKKQRRRYQEMLLLAQSLLKKGAYTDALVKAEAASEIESTQPEAYLLAGLILMQNGDCDSALPFLKKATECSVKEPAKEHIQQAQKACELQKKYMKLVAKGDLEVKKKRYNKAAQIYEQAWKTMPEKIIACKTAAIYYGMSKDYEHSFKLWEQLTHSRSPEISNDARRKIKELKLLMMAESDIPNISTREIGELPGGQSYLKAISLLKDGNAKDAESHLDKAISAIPFIPEYGFFFYRRGQAKFEQQQYKKALYDLRVARMLMPDFVDIYRLLGNAHMYEKNYHQAIEIFNQAIILSKKNKTGSNLYFLRGKAMYKLNRYPSAKKDLNAYLSSAVRDGESRSHAKKLLGVIEMEMAMDKASQGDESAVAQQPTIGKSDQATEKSTTGRKDTFGQALEDF